MGGGKDQHDSSDKGLMSNLDSWISWSCRRTWRPFKLPSRALSSQQGGYPPAPGGYPSTRVHACWILAATRIPTTSIYPPAGYPGSSAPYHGGHGGYCVGHGVGGYGVGHDFGGKHGKHGKQGRHGKHGKHGKHVILRL
ncbi:hypothetical protein MKW98_029580 [Papaver atlanticum]|uniref:Uncharacterized protein n=1 Tax=Papaver atlanticum TaxID=357466 RepID=A0AAD4X8F6_9MAGN|nr:hypothetical protein MKW98_029580 [Papaver atlanticum]